MANFFKRLFTIGKSNVHAALDNFENPIKMTEQGIRDLKEDLNKSIAGLAEVKGLAIRAKRDAEKQKEIASEYERKARLLLQKGQQGQVDSAEADRLASEALVKKEAAMKDAVMHSSHEQKHKELSAKLEASVKTLKSKISSYENELSTLKARAKVSQATKKLNKQLAQVDSGDTIAMLEKMKSKVEQDEALAESYGEIASAETSVDDEINKALDGGGTAEVKAQDSLAALKAQMGM